MACDSWNPSLWKTWSDLYCIFNAMVDDDLEMWGARSSAAGSSAHILGSQFMRTSCDIAHRWLMASQHWFRKWLGDVMHCSIVVVHFPQCQKIYPVLTDSSLPSTDWSLLAFLSLEPSPTKQNIHESIKCFFVLYFYIISYFITNK